MFLRKSIFGTASMLGLAGILAFSGCSSDSTDGTSSDNNGAHGARELGGLGLGLLLPDGSNVNNPTYTITRTSDPSFSQTGNLVISGNVATASISGLPAGSDYKVVLSATRSSPANAPACTGSATFTVIANQTVNVNVVLQCDDTSSDTGNITINGSFNICPKIGSTTVTPNSAAVGASIALSATATDKDGDPISYTWSTAGDGTFSTANAASTSYTCASVGTKTLNLSITDGPTRGCTKTAQPITVTCTAGTVSDAGTPVVDSGTPVVDAGNPVVDSGTPVVDAGNPIVDSGTPVVDAGNPVVDSGTPVVDAGNPVVDAGGPVDAGGGPALRFGTADCDTCLKSQCSLYQGFDPIYDSCTDSACTGSFQCFQRNHCATSTADINQCYCGVGVSNEACLVAGFVAQGPCATLANTTFNSTNAQVVVGDLYDETTQFGVGAALFNCAADLCQAQCVSGTYPAP